MTSLWSRVGLAFALAGLTQVGAAAIKSADWTQPDKPSPSRQAPKPAVKLAQAAVPAQPRAAPAPAELRDRINTLGREFDGRVGISVKSVDDGWSVGWKADELYPQQSVSKLWVAITALDAVDKGRVDLDDTVTLGRSDLTLFHQPIASKVLGNGGHRMTLSELLTEALTKSDNTANDKLMRSVGGPEAVRDMLRAKKLGSIRFYDGERSLQSRIAGLTWTQSYSVGRAFYEARNALPMSVRRAAFNRYVEDPYDGASASGIANALGRLKQGELLSPASTARLLRTMGNTRTGPNRLKGGLRPGWTVSHKTGTGQVLGPVQAGYNDIGILTAPDGSSYAVAVMIKATSAPLPTRMTLMNNVVRAVIQQHDRSKGTASL
ncbi:MAG: class A beta-lactamase [Sphingomonas sp.]|nr:class A beta-lactamase [Sphingomonas sp.]